MHVCQGALRLSLLQHNSPLPTARCSPRPGARPQAEDERAFVPPHPWDTSRIGRAPEFDVLEIHLRPPPFEAMRPNLTRRSQWAEPGGSKSFGCRVRRWTYLKSQSQRTIGQLVDDAGVRSNARACPFIRRAIGRAFALVIGSCCSQMQRGTTLDGARLRSISDGIRCVQRPRSSGRCCEVKS
jgi:hypothetical protein